MRAPATRLLRRGRIEAAAGAVTACALLAATPGYAAAPPPPHAATPAAATWRDSLIWRGQQAWVSVRPDGKYVLQSPAGERVIAAQRWRVSTASPLFDALFAMAQEDMDKDSVAAITDSSFDRGRPIACRCFIAGKEWPFVWTRDVSYSIDLGLWRLEIRCAGSPGRILPIVMPQSEGWQASTTARFAAAAGASCTFTLLQGFNMSDLAQFAHYTGDLTLPPTDKHPTPHPRRVNGGITGPLNSARIGALRVAQLTGEGSAPDPAAATHRSPRNP